MKPVLVLTRPDEQSREIARMFGKNVHTIISPILRIEYTDNLPDIRPYAGVIFTSVNAVAALGSRRLEGVSAYCVGKRTAEAAREAGGDVRLVALDAEDLLLRFSGKGPLLHLRGEHARGEIAKRLNLAGIETHEAVIYRQVAVPLNESALAILRGNGPCILPLYSPRSAHLVGEQAAPIGGGVKVIAMSPAVAQAWHKTTGEPCEIVPEPTGTAMLASIRAALGE